MFGAGVLKGVPGKVLLGVDSPFFSTIILFKNQLFPTWVFGVSLELMMPGKNGNERYP